MCSQTREANQHSGVEFETVPCDFCGAEQGRLILEGPDRLHHLPGQFRFVQCDVCGWIWQNPRPTPRSIGFYYPDDYEPYITAIDDESNAVKRWGRRYGMFKRCRAIARRKLPGRLLDIGCATGTFISEMRRLNGWQVVGVEPNERAANYARTRHGLQVYTGLLADAVFTPASFDVITMWNVIEHLHSPVRDLCRIYDLLKDDGLLVFTIPNLESLDARWFGPAWIGWDLPRHLYLFPRNVLSASLPRLGFSMLNLECLSGSADSFVMSLQLYLEGRSGSSAGQPARLARLMRSFPARIFGAPFFWLLNQTKRSTVITVIAQKHLQDRKVINL